MIFDCALSISFNLLLICKNIPTAGVKGVWPLSIFFNASLRLKYIDLTSWFKTFSIAFKENTIIDPPGGHAKAFYEPVIIISAPQCSISKVSAKKEEAQSQI